MLDMLQWQGAQSGRVFKVFVRYIETEVIDTLLAV